MNLKHQQKELSLRCVESIFLFHLLCGLLLINHFEAFSLNDDGRKELPAPPRIITDKTDQTGGNPRVA